MTRDRQILGNRARLPRPARCIADERDEMWLRDQIIGGNPRQMKLPFAP
ncbi:MAG: hypothetical protein WAS49_16555 [Candidatus Dechloromonas phosphoritropha]|jgi:hypothetical protein|nr:hypothetical protein [Azonexus sp.]MBP9226911.1 hypothetical protein [Azonexus sp.]